MATILQVSYDTGIILPEGFDLNTLKGVVKVRKSYASTSSDKWRVEEEDLSIHLDVEVAPLEDPTPEA